MIVKHEKTEQVKMRELGKLTASVFSYLDKFVVEGVSTLELDQLCYNYITQELNARPAPLNYKGYPKSICTSVNHVVCHGIPDQKKLKNGDIINIDISLEKDGFFGDTLLKCIL